MFPWLPRRLLLLPPPTLERTGAESPGKERSTPQHDGWTVPTGAPVCLAEGERLPFAWKHAMTLSMKRDNLQDAFFPPKDFSHVPSLHPSQYRGSRGGQSQ